MAREVAQFPGSPGPEYTKHIRLVYDSDKHLVYFWGGDYCVPSGRCASHEEFWGYDVATDTWQLILDEKAAAQPGWPKGRCIPGVAYDPRRKVVWMTSGQYRYQNYHPNLVEGGIWAFNPATRVWKREGPSPAEAGLHAFEEGEGDWMVYDPVNDRIVVPDGRNGRVGFFKNGTWSSDSNVPAFADGYVNSANVIQALDTKRNRILLYSAGRGETWAYDLATKRSTRLNKQSLGIYANYTLVYDSANDQMVLWGGGTEFDPNRNDLWVFNFTRNQWSKPTLAGPAPSAGLHAQMAYDAHNNAIVLYNERLFLLRLKLL